MEGYSSPQELREAVLRVGYEIYVNSSHNIFDEYMIEQGLEKAGQSTPQGQQLRKACDYLIESGLFARAKIYGTYGITARGINMVELGTDNVPNNYAPTGRKSFTMAPQDKELQDAFLRAAYDVCLSTRTRMERVDKIAEYIDEQSVGLDRSTPEYAEQIMAAVTFLVNRGSLKRETKDNLVSITDKGIREVENGTTDAPTQKRYVTPDQFSNLAKVGEAPVEIQDSLKRFKEEYPDPAGVAFIMTQFGTTRLHEEITDTIKSALSKHGIKGVRADDARYHDDLFYNVLTYMHGSGLGIAVFERLEEDTFNPNVSLEVGYLFALRKPVCLLNDRTIKTLQTDLMGKLYEPFDPQNPAETIPPKVTKWLLDKRLAQ